MLREISRLSSTSTHSRCCRTLHQFRKSSSAFSPDSAQIFIYLYADEVCPGNQHRPDDGRTYVAWYWSFVDYPIWFQNRRGLSLFVLAFVPIGALRFQHSRTRLYKYFVEIWFKPDGFNFERTGVRLRNGSDAIVVKATYAVTLADEPALAKM